MKNVGLLVQCEECEKWRLLFCKHKLKPDELSKLKKILEEVSYSCGATFDDLELPGRLANLCIKDHQCTDPIEKLYYSCDFEDICVHCGQEDQLQVDNDYLPQCQECQTKERVKRPTKRH